MAGDKIKDTLSLSGLGSALPAATAALSAEDRAGLVNALKSKLQSLAGKHGDVLEALSPSVRKRVEVLREMQGQHNELETKFFEERAALEAKYQKLYEPLYKKRYEIVNGVVEVEGVTNESTDETDKEEKVDEGKGVPDFWLTAMKTHEVLAEEIQERDEAALKYLKDIQWSRIDEPKGFKLEFFFDENPFFKNSVLTKIYHMIDEDDPILEKAIGTEIEWHAGKNLTQKILKKKPKKGSKNAKPVIKTEDCESFFNFFSPPEIPEDEDVDEETAEELQANLEQDYAIGAIIRDKIIPHAVSWFTGEAADGDEYDGMDEGDDEDEGDEDEEDDEEEEEEEEDEDEEEEAQSKKKPASKIKKGGSGAHGNVEQPAECKQQ